MPNIVPFKEKLPKKIFLWHGRYGGYLDKGKIIFLKSNRQHEVWRIDNPKYCLYHRCISRHIKDCYILKDKIEGLISDSIITLDNKEKQVAVNTISIQFGSLEKIDIPCEDNSHEVEFHLVNSTLEVEGLQLIEVADGEVI